MNKKTFMKVKARATPAITLFEEQARQHGVTLQATDLRRSQFSRAEHCNSEVRGGCAVFWSLLAESEYGQVTASFAVRLTMRTPFALAATVIEVDNCFDGDRWRVLKDTLRAPSEMNEQAQILFWRLNRITHSVSEGRAHEIIKMIFAFLGQLPRS